jgi:hypothetical protein
MNWFYLSLKYFTQEQREYNLNQIINVFLRHCFFFFKTYEFDFFLAPSFLLTEIQLVAKKGGLKIIL